MIAKIGQALGASAVIAAIALVQPWGRASAQDSEDLRVRVGLGGQLRPEYVGADSTKLAPLVDVDLARGTNPFRFEAPDYSFGIPVISSGGFSAGPAANFARGRRESDVGAPVGRVRGTFEAGGFASYEFADSLYVRGEVLKGLGGHDGWVGAVGIDRFWRDGDRYVISVGPRLLFSDSRYQRANFGVSPEVSIQAVLPVYRPDGGLHGVAAATGMSYQFNPRWGLFGFGRFERLIGDAARSPIVRRFGSRNQLSGGLGLSYTFTVKK
ncbi:MAG TPA: MipA/OmpV family protein [Sphingomicrobium sp.]|nr:MipA/OmpV family protein [Sphingomicrobium sp.]